MFRLTPSCSASARSDVSASPRVNLPARMALAIWLKICCVFVSSLPARMRMFKSGMNPPCPNRILNSRRVGLGRLVSRLPVRLAFERLDGRRLVEVEHSVELLCKLRVEVVAQPLGLRAVDDADGALQSRQAQKLARLSLLAQVDHKIPDARLVKERLVAAFERGAHAPSAAG